MKANVLQFWSLVLFLCTLPLSTHAFYNPAAGRWINRDPIGENGGRNLAGFANNNSINRADRNGLDLVDEYDGYRADKDLTQYNCVGLAFRTYEFGTLEDAKKSLNDGQKVDCSKDCQPCEKRCRLWEYLKSLQLNDGTIVSKSDKFPDGWFPDFHIVCAPVSCADGKELRNCYCKNGRRPVTGPMLPIEGRPPEKEPYTTNDPEQKPIPYPTTGQPVYQVRKDFKESCYCIPKTFTGI